MLTYKRFNHLKAIGYLDSNFTKCVDTRKSMFGYVFLLAKGALFHHWYIHHGRVQHNQPLLLPPWKLSLWHALRSLFTLIGYGTLFWGLG